MYRIGRVFINKTSELRNSKRVYMEQVMTEQMAVEWKSIDTAPKNGETIVANYGTIDKPETALICWSERPVCMLGPRNGSFPPGYERPGDEGKNGRTRAANMG